MKKITFNIFIDTNALRGGDKNWINRRTIRLSEKYKDNKNVMLNYHIPELVKQEWINNFKVVASQGIASIETMKTTFSKLGIQVNFPEITEDAIKDAADINFEVFGANIIPTPYKDIQVEELIQKAVRHEPPFEKDSDKGIKDAYIAHTIKQFIDDKRIKGDIYIVLTGDGRLNEYLAEIFEGTPINLVKSVSELESQIGLRLEDLNVELEDEASEIVITIGADAPLFQKPDTLRVILKRLYQANIKSTSDAKIYLNKLGFEQNYRTSGRSTPYISDASEFRPMEGIDKVDIGRTTFDSKNNDRLIWSTDISFIRTYSVLINDPDKSDNATVYISHMINLTMLWKSKIQSAILSEPELISLKPYKESKSYSYINPNSQFAYPSVLLDPSIIASATAVSDLGKWLTENNPYIDGFKSAQAAISGWSAGGWGATNWGNIGTGSILSGLFPTQDPPEDKHFWEEDDYRDPLNSQ